ncbi:MAG: glycosyltransferase [Actinomycetota bacterium]|nr:glycosyltransferase [Actinomycetota bacterium]
MSAAAKRELAKREPIKREWAKREWANPVKRAPKVLAIVAARDEAASVAATVRALRGLAGVAEVAVVDDGSLDRTAEAGRSAGARVLRTPWALGKGGALEGALDRLPRADVYLFVDGDIGATAAGIEPVLDAVVSGTADLAVAVLPAPVDGGFGVVKRVAASVVRRVSGFSAQAPLSGQRAVTRECLGACRPLARGFGIETAMLADAARMGFRVMEVPVDVEHHGTGRTVAGFRHRAGQGVDIAAAAVPRLLGIR